jgi:uncharacterized protein (TIGR03437 family)
MNLSSTVRVCLLAAACDIPAVAANQVLLRYLDIGGQASARVITTDKNGNLFTVSAVTDVSGRTLTRVIKMDANGTPLASFDFGATFSTAAATDSQGNLVIAGSANKNGFPLTSQPSGLITDVGAFVMKLDAQLHGIVFSKLLSAPASANAVTLDVAGNIYVAGDTTAADFPLTPDAYQSKPPPNTAFGNTSYAFLTELSPDGRTILYSTYFGGDKVNCLGGSHCIPAFPSTSARAMVLSPSGDIVVAGITDAFDLPVTPGVLGTTCVCGYDLGSAGFAAKFSSSVPRTLVWSTFLSPTQALSPFGPSVRIDAVALDAANNVVIGGSAPNTFPTTPGVVQPSLPAGSQAGGLVAKLNSSATHLIWSTFFGGSDYGREGAEVNALVIDLRGRIIITGKADSNVLPAVNGVLVSGPSYVARLSADGTALEDLYPGPDNSRGAGLALTPAGNFVALGQAGTIWIETDTSGGSLLAIANAASGPASEFVAPSELLSLYGMGIGPQTAQGGQVQNGAFTSSLGGYQVLFDGIAAPLLYAGPTQINTIVPKEVSGQDFTHLQVVSPSGTIDGPLLAVRPAEPSIFQNSLTGLAAALNQDGSSNSPQNPAKAGSIVTMFASGGGTETWTNGRLVPTNQAGPASLPVSILAAGRTSLEVLYAGDAPGLVAGVMQINFRLPEKLSFGDTFAVQLEVGGAISGSASVAVVP